MKAVILVAGFGSRLRPLTDSTPKSLLPIGESNTLTRMVKGLQKQGIEEFIFITGHFEDKIKEYVTKNFADITAHFVRNDKYEATNTGYSLLLAEPFVRGESFVKLDGDVNFDQGIIDKLMATADDANYICLDKTDIDDEVIKAELNDDDSIVALGKYVPVAQAAGESIGIEKIAAQYSEVLFDTLKMLMDNQDNWQEYYEYAYDYLIHNNKSTFKYVDITGLRWVEMDNLEDYKQAQQYFS
jgi:choline kinase